MRPPRTMLRALIAALLVVGALGLSPRPAAADGDEAIAVTITGLSSTVVDISQPDQVIELTGTILNTSATRIRYVNVSFWCSLDPLTEPDDLEQALQSEPGVPVGVRPPPQTEESGHVVVITQGDQEFGPGDRATFTVRATLAELGFTTDDAVYLVGVQVRGIAEDSPSRTTVGRGRILVTATKDRIEVANVVTLTAPPSRSTTGDFMDDGLAEDLTGRLETLLASAERPGATALVDPALLADVQALATPHTVDGEARPANRSASRWADRVLALARAGRVLRLPWGDPDLAAAYGARRLGDVMEWSTDAVAGGPLAGAPLTADLGPHATPELVGELARLGVTRILAENASGGHSTVRTAPFQQPGMGPGARETTAQLTSRRLAEELLAERPRTYMVRTVADTQDAVRDPDVTALVPVPVGAGPDTFDAAVPASDARVGVFSRIDELTQRTDFLTDLTGADASAGLDSMWATAMSRAFPTEAAALAWLDAQPAAAVDPSKVTLSAAKQFVMGSRTNNFPVTVTNGLTTPVTLRLAFTSESPQRITVPPTDFVTVAPGEVLTLNITPEAASNSVVVVHARFETRGGVKFGPEVPIEITATDLGRVGWIIIIVSGAVVLGGTFLRIRAVQAERAKESRGTGQ